MQRDWLDVIRSKLDGRRSLFKFIQNFQQRSPYVFRNSIFIDKFAELRRDVRLTGQIEYANGT